MPLIIDQSMDNIKIDELFAFIIVDTLNCKPDCWSRKWVENQSCGLFEHFVFFFLSFGNVAENFKKFSTKKRNLFKKLPKRISSCSAKEYSKSWKNSAFKSFLKGKESALFRHVVEQNSFPEIPAPLPLIFLKLTSEIFLAKSNCAKKTWEP